MNVKAVVKVMNFHALLRVDASRKKAEKYRVMEDELRNGMSIIMNNRNLRLDKLIKLPSPGKPALCIYIGSDYGFCGSVNSSINSRLTNDINNKTPDEKLVVGKKIKKSQGIDLFILYDEFESRFGEICEYLKREISDRPWSGIDIVYNHYYNMSSISPVKKRIYPLDVDLSTDDRNILDTDYVIEGEPMEMLRDMMFTYLQYEVKTAMVLSYASENIMRQNATSESLKKLDEAEEIAVRDERKRKNRISFSKTVDSYIRQKSLKTDN